MVEDDCEELIDAGEHVISVVTSRARGRVSGLEVECTGVWTIHEGKVVRVEWFESREEALEAAGLTGVHPHPDVGCWSGGRDPGR
jgi:hypothetical protein